MGAEKITAMATGSKNLRDVVPLPDLQPSDKSGRMSDDPNEWVSLLNKMPPELAGALMAMFIAVLRIIYDGKETRPMRIILESCICGALSLTASFGITAMGLNMNWAIFVGGVIGYLGAESVRVLALSIIKHRFGKKDGGTK